MKKRVLSLLMALVTLLTILPTAAFAAESTGQGIKPVQNPLLVTTRVNSKGQNYVYAPPTAAGKQLYCMDLGYSYRSGNSAFLSSYTYTSATGADADTVWKKAVSKTGLGEMNSMVQANVKWMMSYVADYKGEIPGSVFMAVQTYIWDNQSNKSAGGDTEGDIDAGGFANKDTYDGYVSLYQWMLGEKAKEDAKLKAEVESYASQGIQASIVEDESSKWAVLAQSSKSGRQAFFAYHTARKVVPGTPKPSTPDPEDPPVAGDGEIVFQKVIAGTTNGLDGALYNIYRDGQIIGSDTTKGGGYIKLDKITTGLYSFVEREAPKGYAIDPTPHSVYVDVTDGKKTYTVSAADTTLPSLKIIKTDAQTGKALEGTVFEVVSVMGSYSTTATTGADGTVVLEDLEPGVYIVREKSVKEPYILTKTEQTVALLPGKTSEAAFQDYQKPGLEILKKNIATGDPIANVTFKIEQIGGGNYSTSATTDSKGRIFLESIPIGTYKIYEKNVPDNVIKSDIPQTVDLEPGVTRTVTFHNSMKPSLTIKKVDSITGDPIKGAKFHVYYGSDHTSTGELNDLGSHFTDETGQIILTEVNAGWYKVVEESPAAGYTIKGSDTQELYLAGDKPQTVTFENTPLSALVVYKYDSKTGAALQGAEFDVRYLGGTSGSGGTVIGHFKTSENGSFVVTNLKAGTYIVEETRSSPYYSIDTPPQTAIITGKEQDVVTLRFSNSPFGSVIIKKLSDDANKTPLAGAVFLITDDKGAFIGNENGEFTTDKTGSIKLPKLPAGTTVIAKEIRAPEGFALDSTPQTVYIQAGEVHGLTFYDKPLCNLTILKRDAVTKKPLAKAEFIVKDSHGVPIGTNNGRYVTGSNGTVTITGLTPNATVIVSEDKAPIGYIKDETPQTIVVKSGKPNSLTFDNEPATTLVIRKYIEGTDNEPLSGVAFKVVYGDGGAVGPDDGVYYTDKAGEIVLTGLEPGRTVKAYEIKTVDGFILDGTPQDIKIEAGQVQQLTYWNKRETSLQILKQSSEDKKPLAGAEFLVTDGDGRAIGTNNGRYTSDENGLVTITGLHPGQVLVVHEERAPQDYQLNKTPQTITIKDGPNSLIFENTPLGCLLIRKVDADTKEPLSGVQFTIAGCDGCVFPEETFTTDSNGLIRLKHIPSGCYTVQEIRAKEGYLLDDSTHNIKVQAGECKEITFENKALGGLIIHKLDSVTKQPIEGVQFKITYSDGRFVDAESGHLSSNGLYWTDKQGQIKIDHLVGTVVVTEVQTVEGYTIHEETRTQTIKINPNDTQTLYVYNDPIGGVEIIKVNEDDQKERIPNTTFEIRKLDDELIDTVTTDKNGRVFVPLKDGSYYAKEIKAAENFRLDDTPHYFEVEDGKTAQLVVTNKANSGIIIHKIDSVTEDGIYGVKFVLYDHNHKPIDEYTTDNEGYIYIDEIPGGLSGRFYLRELEAAPGYELDKQYKSVHVHPGKTIEIEWENTPITGQIQLTKYAAEFNTVTGTAPGAPLKGAVYEIINPRNNKVVDHITTDARGIAASRPLPLGRYQLREVAAPAYWQVDTTVHDVTLEYPGQIIKLSAFDKAAKLGVSITKRGNTSVLAGSQMRYNITVANTSNVDLGKFFWHDRIPTDIARATVLSTGTYSARLNYRVLYKTNYSANYQVLASNLLTSNNYTFALNAIPMQAGEVVTDVYFDFGKVPVGFQSVTHPTLSVMVSGHAVNGYQMVNRADVGGFYGGTWQTANASWVTIIQRLWNIPSLPKTGY